MPPRSSMAYRRSASASRPVCRARAVWRRRCPGARLRGGRRFFSSKRAAGIVLAPRSSSIRTSAVARAGAQQGVRLCASTDWIGKPEIEELCHRFEVAESRGRWKVGAAHGTQRRLPLRPVEPAAQFRGDQREAERKSRHSPPQVRGSRQIESAGGSGTRFFGRRPAHPTTACAVSIARVRIDTALEQRLRDCRAAGGDACASGVRPSPFAANISVPRSIIARARARPGHSRKLRQASGAHDAIRDSTAGTKPRTPPRTQTPRRPTTRGAAPPSSSTCGCRP